MAKSYDRRKCMVCKRPIVAYEVISGVPLKQSKGGTIQQIYGHYHCVKGELGPERVLLAHELGLLPMLPDSIFTDDGRLKKYVELAEGQAERPLERVYEFIKS